MVTEWGSTAYPAPFLDKGVGEPANHCEPPDRRLQSLPKVKILEW